jgi:hypothetical protein
MTSMMKGCIATQDERPEGTVPGTKPTGLERGATRAVLTNSRVLSLEQKNRIMEKVNTRYYFLEIS